MLTHQFFKIEEDLDYILALVKTIGVTYDQTSLLVDKFDFILAACGSTARELMFLALQEEMR